MTDNQFMAETLTNMTVRSAVEDFIVFGKPYIGREEIEEVVDSLKKGWIGTGPKVAHFRERFRNYIGAQYAEPVNSCSAALFLSHLALGIGQGETVIKMPMTYVATSHAIEASYGSEKTGTTADISCFFFYVTNNLCCGEGEW